ncbi:hypothetical protein JKA74_08615 [Marivirga sp. S37H4]|uniref:Uncharacterized protein n=1 Tax=Marivirga aurantiaca TaxID=2802615 RepID=A0A934WXQ8_9BACT|nr:hypothetical protein [Marivirga aurantiaca]MBK6265098.1 hypothetical protein [Marivirga aurantiaca]
MKSICFISIFFLFAFCNFQNESKNKGGKSSNQTIENKSIDKSLELSSFQKNNSETIELPVIGTFELGSAEIDSTNEYGAGDCWGKIKRYSLANVGLAIDSMSCGEYGFTYTYYLLSQTDFVQSVFIQKSESILNPENNSYFYIQEEQVIDFNSDPAISMIRVDTVYEYNLRQNQIKKKFVTDALKDKQKTYEHLEMEYQGTWTRQLD